MRKHSQKLTLVMYHWRKMKLEQLISNLSSCYTQLHNSPMGNLPIGSFKALFSLRPFCCHKTVKHENTAEDANHFKAHVSIYVDSSTFLSLQPYLFSTYNLRLAQKVVEGQWFDTCKSSCIGHSRIHCGSSHSDLDASKNAWYGQSHQHFSLFFGKYIFQERTNLASGFLHTFLFPPILGSSFSHLSCTGHSGHLYFTQYVV